MDDQKAIREPDNGTVDHWMGQEVDRDQKVADDAGAEAGGDMARAERIFDERSERNRPDPAPAVPGCRYPHPVRTGGRD